MESKQASEHKEESSGSSGVDSISPRSDASWTSVQPEEKQAEQPSVDPLQALSPIHGGSPGANLNIPPPLECTSCGQSFVDGSESEEAAVSAATAAPPRSPPCMLPCGHALCTACAFKEIIQSAESVAHTRTCKRTGRRRRPHPRLTRSFAPLSFALASAAPSNAAANLSRPMRSRKSSAH